MFSNMQPRYLYRIVIGIVFLIGGIISAFTLPENAIIPTIFLTAGIVFLLTGILRHRKNRDGPESDERSKKIGAWALSYAWLTGIIGACLLFWLDYLGVFRLSAQSGYGLIVLILTISAVICQVWLFRKGDVC